MAGGGGMYGTPKLDLGLDLDHIGTHGPNPGRGGAIPKENKLVNSVQLPLRSVFLFPVVSISAAFFSHLSPFFFLCSSCSLNCLTFSLFPASTNTSHAASDSAPLSPLPCSSRLHSILTPSLTESPSVLINTDRPNLHLLPKHTKNE